MRNRVLGVALGALTLLTAACGGAVEGSSEPQAAEQVTSATPQDATSEATDAASPSAGPEPSTAAEASSGAPAGGSNEPTVLFGVVGTTENPEAFEITLTDESGEPVTEIPAGD